MAEMVIPPPFQRALRLLADLDPEAADSLTASLESAGDFRDVGDLQDLTRQSFTEDVREEAERLVPALLSLRAAVRSASNARLAKLTSESVDLVDMDDEARSRLRERLGALLKLPALRTSGSAIALLTENDRNYQSCRVLTDLRPVFEEDISVRPTGAVIVQTFQMQTWSRTGDVEGFFVAMDEADLREIRETIDRALEKTQTLKTMLGDQGIAHFQLDKKEI